MLDSEAADDDEAFVANKEAVFEDSKGSLHGGKEFATAWLTQIFDMGASETVSSNDINPIFIISESTIIYI